MRVFHACRCAGKVARQALARADRYRLPINALPDFSGRAIVLRKISSQRTDYVIGGITLQNFHIEVFDRR